jgi:hypothetical protein
MNSSSTNCGGTSTGARWKTEQVGPLVELGALAAVPEWQHFWSRN